MSFKIVRNDITEMNTEAIVNTANSKVSVGSGCDDAIYTAAGWDELLNYRTEKIGEVEEGEVFITPGYALKAKYIIHAVSPVYKDGQQDEEEKLRCCYRKSLKLAKEQGISSISFPLISTGSYGYPKEEGLRIAVDEINAFLLNNEMDVYLVVFDDRSTQLGSKLYSELEEYIDRNYVEEAQKKEYRQKNERPRLFGMLSKSKTPGRGKYGAEEARRVSSQEVYMSPSLQYLEADICAEKSEPEEEIDSLTQKLNERIAHRSDTFSEYLMYLIESKGMKNSEVYNRAIIDKRYFSKIKNNKDFHPEKLKALCLCVGAQLSLDETKDLLARAGYALSPADLTDIIFTFFIENNHFDVIDIDIQLEEHGLPCIIS